MDNRKFAANASATPPAVPATPSSGYPTNGDPLQSVEPTTPGDFWFHQIGEELRGVIAGAGLAPSTANLAQLLEAIQRLIDAQSGNYALDTGAANAYVVAFNPAIVAYSDGMTVRFRIVNAVTGASTLNAGGGAVALVNDVGAALVTGDGPSGSIVSATYVAALNKFMINSLVPSQAMTQAAADARYAALNGSATESFKASYVDAPIPQNSKSAAYTTVLADANKHILHPAADGNARVFTIDSNANVPYAIGTTLTFVNKINTVTIAITTDTLTWAGPGTTGSRTLAANGQATAMKIGATEWMISGVGLS